MVDDRDQKAEKFEFDAAGEVPVYISLEQATLMAMEAARDDPGDYGERFQGVGMVFDVVQQEEGEDYYTITLSFSPEGDFTGTPGREQFFIAKEGRIAHRQLRGRPRRTGEWPLPPTPIVIGIAVAVTAAVLSVVGVALFTGGDGDESEGQNAVTAPVSLGEPSETPARPSENPEPAPTETRASPRAASTFVPLQTGRFQPAGAETPPGWSTNRSGISSYVELVEGTRRFDSLSVRLEVSSIPRFDAEVRQDIPVNPGEVWSIAVWGLRMDPYTGADLRLRWLDAGKEPLATVTERLSGEGRWAYTKIQDQSAPSGAAWLRFSVRCISSGISPCGVTFVDGAMACRCRTAPDFPSAENALRNPSFELSGE
jgi:hypothetical protein